MQRQFTSGSRQAPDPIDQYLEEHNFYRKHTARDSSCLFRVISEQMFDTQRHHFAIRQRCVRYMRKHKRYFAQLVDKDINLYLDDLSKPKTYGSLIELQAAGFLFQRNIILFESFNLGSFFNYQSNFSGLFRVFYTPERHFDSVFTSEYIKSAAICQAICYEILYKDLYKLADITFAVEHMLHYSSFDTSEYRTEYDDNGYCLRIHLPDGRFFEFDSPDNTNCILENYRLCHFHYSHFSRCATNLTRDTKLGVNHIEFDNNMHRPLESLLPKKHTSCVRQLLQEGITPFPYKVAKALDPNMYRNIEFDSWNEARKEMRFHNWYNGDGNFKVGAKCHVKLHKSTSQLFICHIQEISTEEDYCLVFIEQLGQKHVVPYEALTPLPDDQFKPWSLPYRVQRHMQKYGSLRFTRQYNYRLKYNEQFSAGEYCELENSKQNLILPNHGVINNRNNCFYKLKQYTHLENFRTHTVEYCTMPLTVEHDPNECNGTNSDNVKPQLSNENNLQSDGTNHNVENVDGIVLIKKEENGIDKECPEECLPSMNTYEMDRNVAPQEMFMGHDVHCYYPIPHYPQMNEEYFGGYGYDRNVQLTPPILSQSNGTLYYAYNPPGSGGFVQPVNNNIYIPTQISNSAPATTVNAVSGVALHNPNFCPTNAYYATPIQNSYNGPNASPVVRPLLNLVNTIPNNRINWEAKQSSKTNGTDLPKDVATLRYFYNLGVEHHHNQLRKELNFNNKSDIEKLVPELASVTLDENASNPEIKPDSNNNSSTNNNRNSFNQNNGPSQQSSLNNEPNTPSQQHSSYQYEKNQNKGNNGNGNRRTRYYNSSNNKDRHLSNYQRCNTYNNTSQQSGYPGNTTSRNFHDNARSTNMKQQDGTITGDSSTPNLTRVSYLNPTNSGNPVSTSVIPDPNVQIGQRMPYGIAPVIGTEPSQVMNNYNPNANPSNVIAFGTYDYNGLEQNGQNISSHSTNANGSNLLIPMQITPVGPSQYGVYAASSPAGIGMHPANAAMYPAYSTAPPQNIGLHLPQGNGVGIPPPPQPIPIPHNGVNTFFGNQLSCDTNDGYPRRVSLYYPPVVNGGCLLPPKGHLSNPAGGALLQQPQHPPFIHPPIHIGPASHSPQAYWSAQPNVSNAASGSGPGCSAQYPSSNSNSNNDVSNCSNIVATPNDTQA